MDTIVFSFLFCITFSFLSSLWTGSSGASVRPKKCEHVGHTKRKNKGRHIMLALEERKTSSIYCTCRATFSFSFRPTWFHHRSIGRKERNMCRQIRSKIGPKGRAITFLFSSFKRKRKGKRKSCSHRELNCRSWRTDRRSRQLDKLTWTRFFSFKIIFFSSSYFLLIVFLKAKEKWSLTIK